MGFLSNFYIAFLLILSYSLHKSLADVPCAPVKTRTCTGENPLASLVHVFITDCFEEPCAFTRGQNVTLEMDIDFNQDVESLEASLIALIGGAEIRWDGINKNACEDLISEHECPIQKGAYVAYGVDLYVLPTYPQVRTDVKFLLVDENGETQICWMIKAQVT